MARRPDAPVGPPQASEQDAALAQYRRRAAIYDIELALFEPIRRRAMARLSLQPGDRVLDLGCGTGLSLPHLCEAVGPGGHVFGVEQSPEMMAKARQRVAARGWKNVTLVCAPVEAAALPIAADAALFHFTHDILRQPEAVAHVIGHLRPGARVVASGLRWAPAWMPWVNLLVLPAALHSVSSLEGLKKPWSHLAPRIGPLQVESLLLGAVYVASGKVRGDPG
jgi:SAM-dependent methyltransferase